MAGTSAIWSRTESRSRCSVIPRLRRSPFLSRGEMTSRQNASYTRIFHGSCHAPRSSVSRLRSSMRLIAAICSLRIAKPEDIGTGAGGSGGSTTPCVCGEDR